jgi:nanoRNase/pAp phosphatase (c-di-AMP/oligoRNAs hydrolase)
MKKSIDKIEQLKTVLQNHSTMLIVIQDNPDPDSIAQQWPCENWANTLNEEQCSISHVRTGWDVPRKKGDY